MIIDHYRLLWALLVPALVAAFSLAAAVLVSVRVAAHSWYPLECCAGQDCGPATMSTVAGAVYSSAGLDPKEVPAFVTTVTVDMPIGKQTVVVPPNFPRRESPDGRMHACIYVGKLQCLFMPPAF